MLWIFTIGAISSLLLVAAAVFYAWRKGWLRPIIDRYLMPANEDPALTYNQGKVKEFVENSRQILDSQQSLLGLYGKDGGTGLVNHLQRIPFNQGQALLKEMLHHAEEMQNLSASYQDFIDAIVGQMNGPQAIPARSSKVSQADAGKVEEEPVLRTHQYQPPKRRTYDEDEQYMVWRDDTGTATLMSGAALNKMLERNPEWEWEEDFFAIPRSIYSRYARTQSQQSSDRF